jgi:hypothetical protein
VATPQITRLGPIPRQQGLAIPGAVVPPRWVDAHTIAVGVAETYTLPTDAAGRKASILRLTCTSGILYVKWDGAATIPAADVTNGTASFLVAANQRRRFLAAPSSAYALSFITSAATAAVIIEAWS